MKQAIINDAIHKNMVLPKELAELTHAIIDKSTFQRLRHIKQLGLAELIFPSATHNRFSHSLGAAHVANQICHQLDLPLSAQKYAIASALLHDIGHGPFSHDFEKILAKPQNQNNTINHEAWTDPFLKEFDTALQAFDLDFEIISSTIQKNQTPTQLDKDSNLYLVQDIISSQLDADRLDYLLRDSLFCGVPYGQVDIAWIINNLAIVTNAENKPRIGVYKKGWKAVEHFLLARKLMTQNVYNHPKNSIIGYLVRFLLNDIADTLANSSNQEKKVLTAKIANQNLSLFLQNIGQYRHSTSMTQSDFIAENFQFYKMLTDYDIWLLIRDLSIDSNIYFDCQKIATRFYKRELHETISFDSSKKNRVAEILKADRKKNGYAEWQIFLIENQVRSYASKDDPIFILDDRNKPIKISDLSVVLSSIGDREESETFIAVDRAFKHSAHFKTLQPHLESIIK